MAPASLDAGHLASGTPVCPELLQQVVTAAPVGIFALEQDRWVVANGRLQELTGLDEAALLRGELWDLVHPDDRAQLDGERAGWSTLRTTEGPVTASFRIVRPDGEHRWLRLRMTPLRGGGGRVFAGAIEDVTSETTSRFHNTLLLESLTAQATQDPLTGLPNRTRFYEAVDEALAARAAPHTVGVLFCDLDRFKPINDSLGHAAGDRLLRIVGQRLSGVLRQGDLAGRIGGDEFVVLAARVADHTELLHLAGRVREVIDEPVRLDVANGTEVRLTGSVGAALADPEDTAAALIARADEAMYRAKHLGKNRVELYHAEAHHSPSSSLVAEQSLRAALDRRELHMVLQPIVSLPDRRIVGAEALVRWHHPDRGVLSPTDFLHVAEDTGLIGRLGAWVLSEGVAHAARWAEDPTLPAGLRVHVNLSGHQLLGGDVADVVGHEIAQARLPAGSLCVELTEALLTPDEASPSQQLEALRALGVLVAIDDFGTGPSSLAQLRRYPVDMLKLDPALVAGVLSSRTDAAILSGVQHLAAAMEIQTVAVGVEDEAQARAMQAMGCRLAQGQLFAEPSEPAEFEAAVRGQWLDQRVVAGDVTLPTTDLS